MSPLLPIEAESDFVPQKPLLSICIPTYNRSAWLRATLDYSAQQVKAANGLVELVVSDNASTDDTAKVVEEAQEWGPIRYSRNETNIGANPNMHKLVSELAKGKYIWVMGDDDFLLPNAVNKILSVIQQHPEVSLIHVNHSTWVTDSAPTGLVPISVFDKITKRKREDTSNYYVDHIKDLLPGDENCFTPVFLTIFEQSHAIAAFDRSVHHKVWEHIESVISHAIYVAEHMMSLPAYYVGNRVVVSSDNSSWNKYKAGYYLIYLPKLYDIFQRNGADKALLDQYRFEILRAIQFMSLLKKMVMDKETPMRSQFSLASFIKTFSSGTESKKLLKNILAGVVRDAVLGLLYKFRPTRFLIHKIYIRREASTRRSII